MQTLPLMRRSSAHQANLAAAGFLVALLIYGWLSSRYLWLPPLFGALFLYFVRLLRAQRYYTVLFFALVSVALELDKGYFPCVLFLSYVLVFVFLHPKITRLFNDFSLLDALYVPAVYVLYLALNTIILFLNGEIANIWTRPIAYYVALEAILVLGARWIAATR